MKVLFIYSFFFISSLLIAQNLIGKVIKVADGDTVTILTEENEPIKIRLYGIDCPEKGQDYGTKATKFTNDLCYGKQVEVENKGTDKYKRTLGVIWVDSVSINEELLKNGLAWHYKYFDKTQKYADLEQEAKNNKLNIWSITNPIAPWDFRKDKKRKTPYKYFDND